MNAQVELLMQIQDLDLMIRELGNERMASAEKKMGFELRGIDPSTARERRGRRETALLEQNGLNVLLGHAVVPSLARAQAAAIR